MGQVAFAQRLAAALEGVDLSSTSSSKFDPLIVELSNHWGIEPTSIGVKALRDTKNYGNRIGEATRHPIDLLVLLSESELEVARLAPIIESRALRLVPTLVVIRREGRWEAAGALLPEDADNPFDFDVPVELLSRAEVEANEPDKIDALVARLFDLREGPASSLDGMLDELAAGTVLTLKRVVSGKNLSNRVSEAVGRKPAVLAIRVPQELVLNAHRALETQLVHSPATKAFIVSDDTTTVNVEAVAALPGPDSRSDSAPRARRRKTLPPPTSSDDPGTEIRYRQLERVKELHRRVPNDANANQLYEENNEANDRFAYENKTLRHLRVLLGGPQRNFIVLTGNAGHGKTHMCRRLLEANGANEGAMLELKGDIRGDKEWTVPGASRPVMIMKDLSDLTPPEDAKRLEEMFVQNRAHVVVCANEGRLRDVVSRCPEEFTLLLDALELGLSRGQTTPPGRDDIHLLNLNFQATSSGDGGFLKHVLDYFLNHESAWKVCRRCQAHNECPIIVNRDELAQSPGSPAENATRRAVLIDLVRTAEEGGYVLTFRETLKLVGYLVTGGLTCEEIEELHRRNRFDELRAHQTLPLLFEAPMSDDDEEVLPLLRRLRRMDPGLVAIRPVDERIHEALEDSGAFGSSLFGDGAAQLHRKRDLDKEEASHRASVRHARRQAWFVAPEESEEGILRSARLGLRHHHTFRAAQQDPDASARLSIIRRLVRGLHVIQGAVGVDSLSSLHLVDPAFGRSGSHAAVIARSLRVKDLDLQTESEWWRHLEAPNPPPILESVEWLDRRLFLVDRPSARMILALDLLAFEFVMNAGTGIVMRNFHSAERRRILRTLAKHAELGPESNDDIRVLLERGEGRLTVERDDTILLERTS